MGFRYPHEEAEFLVLVSITLIAWGLILPLAQRLPSWAGIPLAVLPLVLLVTIFWYRKWK